ncbi:putative isoflavone-7-O-beta-glucoside 6''-O-malonyltransferase [Medicago truncatula]|uniref:Putative isoflavone-7-O-beta-glucoside 6''-O-malonyltransferase n=1 Tax=Medicago truncatula TaxID=3880 RepID=A0A072UVA5_MEDTR|nr:transferase family protein [Medicago truncatula]RHN66522.1 putative isoflavone-7-O-beta-glucoside 6''-O-malonyltransferase [Medicago truncatula]
MAHKLIEQTLVVPATTKTTTSLPLTFLDLHFAGPVYVKRLFFYPFAYSTNHFCKTTLPSLKKSLSLTLQHFFPLAGNLISPPPPQKPFILYTEEDSVAFTIIESSADFNHLSTKQPLKNLKETNHLVPTLTNKNKFDDNNIENDTFILPLLALQVTVFPDHGLCIGITYCHVMDDRSCDHFMKSWSFIHQRGDVVELKSLPCFDREVLRDPRGLEDVFLRDYFVMRKSWKHRLIAESQSKEEHQDFVKAIIVFGKEEIERMKKICAESMEEK